MKKAILIVLGLGLLVGTWASAQNGPSQNAGKSNKGHLYLFEKTGEPDWDIVDEGAWGKMQFNRSGPTLDFVFNGHRVSDGEDYTLIYYPDPWPGNGLICLGTGTGNSENDVHIKGSVDPEADLPDLIVDSNEDGAKIWLVLSSDVDCVSQNMIGWQPGEYLFEGELFLNFDYTGP